MEGRHHKVMLVRLSFFIIISVVLLIGLIWSSSIENITFPNILILLMFFGIDWGAILAFVIFEKLVQI